MAEPSDRVALLQERIRTLLEGERQRIQAEIRSYPTPIPRCDQQFNLLIDMRERVFQELARLDAVTGTSATAANGAATLAAFIDSCACLDAASRLRLQADLSEGFGKPTPMPAPATGCAGR
jgi:hypothetical protein